MSKQGEGQTTWDVIPGEPYAKQAVRRYKEQRALGLTPEHAEWLADPRETENLAAREAAGELNQ